MQQLCKCTQSHSTPGCRQLVLRNICKHKSKGVQHADNRSAYAGQVSRFAECSRFTAASLTGGSHGDRAPWPGTDGVRDTCGFCPAMQTPRVCVWSLGSRAISYQMEFQEFGSVFVRVSLGGRLIQARVNEVLQVYWNKYCMCWPTRICFLSVTSWMIQHTGETDRMGRLKEMNSPAGPVVRPTLMEPPRPDLD